MTTKSSFPCTVLLLLTMFSSGIGAASYQLDGVWAYEGYGRILEVDSDAVNIFAVTRSDCVLLERISQDEYLHRIDRMNLSEKDVFSYYDVGLITRYDLTRMQSLPSTCSATRSKQLRSDPEENFDFFWDSFNENYAFFDLRDVDWDAVYEQYRPGITAKTSDGDLIRVFTEMIKLLGDRHVSLRGNNFPRVNSGQPGTLAALLQKELPDGETATYENVAVAAKQVVAQYYLESSRADAFNEHFAWGWAADGIGYLSVDSMCCYVDDEEATLLELLWLVDEVMNQVISDLEGAKGIIVDARWNSGGEDSIALQIAAHFTAQHHLAFTKRARNGDSLNPEQEVFIPTGLLKRFEGPVVYLVSRDTISAAEIFSLAMKVIPTVTSLGEHTAGVFSDTHAVKLPNGWVVRLSNEVYKAMDGVVYEGPGVPPDATVPVYDESTFESYIRSGMDKAIAMLQ